MSPKSFTPTFLFVLGLLLGPTVFAQDDDDDFFIFDEEEDPTEEISDPFESLNRATFSFNDKLYRGYLKPIAVGYRVVPEPARISVSNFFSNLGTPVSAMSALLQFDLPNTGTEVSRFLLNSTLGIAGLFDVASHMGLEQDTEDLGQTFGRWGMGHGFYVVIPFLGASSFRDGVGMLGNTAMNPVYEELEAGEILGIRFIEAETALSLDQDTYEAFYDSALDPYIFFRSAYVQNRAGRVEQ